MSQTVCPVQCLHSFIIMFLLIDLLSVQIYVPRRYLQCICNNYPSEWNCMLPLDWLCSIFLSFVSVCFDKVTCFTPCHLTQCTLRDSQTSVSFRSNQLSATLNRTLSLADIVVILPYDLGTLLDTIICTFKKKKKLFLLTPCTLYLLHLLQYHTHQIHQQYYNRHIVP